MLQLEKRVIELFDLFEQVNLLEQFNLFMYIPICHLGVVFSYFVLYL